MVDRAQRNAHLSGAGLADAEQWFDAPPPQARVMVRWWWFGPAQTEETIDRELHAMRDAGLGGAEIAVVYPFGVDGEPAAYPYLSETFLARLRYAVVVAGELGLRVDVTLGGGWSYGGPHVPVELAARRLRWQTTEVPPQVETTELPRPAAGESLVAAYVGRGTLEDLPVDFEPVPVPDDAQAVDLPPSRGPRVVALAWCTPTGQTVKRAPLGGEGYVLDHYSRGALDLHLGRVAAPLLDAVPPGTVTAVFCDSLEVRTADWTPRLVEEFASRRGYDARPLLPWLLHEHRPEARRLRVDLGRTLTELYEESFLRPLRRWAHERGALLRLQGYGQPPAALSSYRHVDLVEGEGWGWDGVPPTRWASSAAHVLGESVVSSETWTWVHSPSLRAVPLDLVGEAHEHLLLGVNQLVGHGWPSSPAGAEAPGWVFYASGDLSDTNPWWPAMPDLAAYLQRLCALLRLGAPVRQVAVHVPDAAAYARLGGGRGGSVDLWAATRDLVGPVLPRAVRDAGFDFDLLDDHGLRAAGDRYGAVVVAVAVEDVDDGTRRELDRLEAGGVLVLTPPSAEPGAGTSAAWESLGPDLTARLRPDVVRADTRLAHVRRRLRDAEVFVLVNTGADTLSETVTLGATRTAWEVWDPRTQRRTRHAGGPHLALTLAPYAAVVLVGHDGDRPHVPVASPRTSEHELPVTWSGSDGTEATFPVRLDWRDPAARVSVTAEVERPPSSSTRLVLDLGEGTPHASDGTPPRMSGASYRARYDAPVSTAAVVRVNGHTCGTLWAPPYRLDLTPHLEPGANRVEVTVLGSAVGALVGSSSMRDRVLRLTETHGRRFALQDVGEPADPPRLGLRHRPRLLVATH